MKITFTTEQTLVPLSSIEVGSCFTWPRSEEIRVMMKISCQNTAGREPQLGYLYLATGEFYWVANNNDLVLPVKGELKVTLEEN